ncbi:hypothetical protein AbraIFM66950_011983 [Aspergillus brasiliensis]|nr:hypothetical protein AbraIFM66950_011983 [Aspergillus brasiliensis]
MPDLSHLREEILKDSAKRIIIRVKTESSEDCQTTAYRIVGEVFPDWKHDDRILFLAIQVWDNRIFINVDVNRDNYNYDTAHKDQTVLPIIACLRNLGDIPSYLPSASDAKTFEMEIEQIVHGRRMKKGPSQKDFIQHFLTGGPAGRQCTPEETNANTYVAVLGGSDTTSTTMNQMLRYLAITPEVQEKLRAELNTICSAGEELTVELTRKLPYLNGVFNEGVQPGNPAPIWVPVKIPPGGLHLGDTYIPGHVEVKVPFRVTLADSRWFPKGDCFNPERCT